MGGILHIGLLGVPLTFDLLGGCILLEINRLDLLENYPKKHSWSDYCKQRKLVVNNQTREIVFTFNGVSLCKVGKKWSAILFSPSINFFQAACRVFLKYLRIFHHLELGSR